MVGEKINHRPLWQKIGRVVMKLIVVAGLIGLAKLGMAAFSAKLAALESGTATRAMAGMIVTLMIGYIILLAVPFVPGIEIGLALLVLQGAEAAPYVYLATVMGLFLAFCIGQCAPLDRLIGLCEECYLLRVANLLAGIKSTPREERLAKMHDRLPGWIAPFICDYRYVTLAVTINLPGSFALGGGGGILMVAGITRLFQTHHVLLTLALATLPVPLAVWLLGTEILS